MTLLDSVRIRQSSMVLAAVLIITGGCRPRDDDRSSEQAQENRTKEPGQAPAPVRSAVETESASPDSQIPRFAKNSPFTGNYELATEPEGKRLWARSFLGEKAPEFVVEKWLTPKPQMEGMYVLIEYWATWCGPCRRSIPLLNEIHRRFEGKLAVVGISDESEEAVRAMKDPRIEYSVAVDTQARMKKALGIVGIPHAIILEPQGTVIWEGFPLLKGHELTLETIEQILTGQTRSRSTQEP
jgi:thiol-disulfide isomerase/thioredoxin